MTCEYNDKILFLTLQEAYRFARMKQGEGHSEVLQRAVIITVDE